MLLAILGALGWPADRVLALVVAAAAVTSAGAGWAIAHNLNRWVSAQRDGVFRVRRVV